MLCTTCNRSSCRCGIEVAFRNRKGTNWTCFLFCMCCGGATLLSQVIAQGLKSGSASLDNPNVRTLLEACASAGIGTTGLNTKIPKKASGDGCRKSPGSGGKKSTSPSGAKKPPAAKTAATAPTAATVEKNGDRNGDASSKKKPPPTAPPAAAAATANGDAGAERKPKGGGKTNAAKSEAGKTGSKNPPKSPVAEKSSVTRRRTPTKCVGKPGLALPQTLFPELARSIESGGKSVHMGTACAFCCLGVMFVMRGICLCLRGCFRSSILVVAKGTIAWGSVVTVIGNRRCIPHAV